MYARAAGLLVPTMPSTVIRHPDSCACMVRVALRPIRIHTGPHHDSSVVTPGQTLIPSPFPPSTNGAACFVMPQR